MSRPGSSNGFTRLLGESRRQALSDGTCRANDCGGQVRQSLTVDLTGGTDDTDGGMDTIARTENRGAEAAHPDLFFLVVDGVAAPAGLFEVVPEASHGVDRTVVMAQHSVLEDEAFHLALL